MKTIKQTNRHNSQTAPWLLCAALLLASVCHGPAANISKANNGTALNSGASWIGGVPPVASDLALWDTNVTAASSVSLGADVNWSGLALGNYPPYATYVNDPGGSVTITNTGINTLTLGASGIDLSISTNWNLTITNNNVSLNGNQTWNIYAGRTVTIGGNVGGTGNLLKLGAGALTLNGTNGFNGQIIGGGGQINLNFTAASAPTNNIVNPTQPLIFDYNGTAVAVTGKAGTTNMQTFNGVQLKGGVGSISSVPGGSGGSNYVEIGAITRSTGGGAINFGPLSATAPIHTTTANDASGIIGPWATIVPTAFNAGANTYATNWACVDANGYITNYSGWTTLTSLTIAGGANSNVRIAATTTPAGTVTVGAGTTTINTIVNNDSTARTVDIPAGSTLRLGANGGILRAQTGGSVTIGASAGTPGILTAGGADNTPGELIINSQNGPNNKGSTGVTINSTISDNGSGAVSVSIIGGDQVVIRSTNTYSGPTYIRAGRVDINSGGVRLGPGPIYISGAPVSAFIQNGVGQNLGGAPGNSQIGGSLYLNGANYTNDFYLKGAGGVDTSGGILRSPGTLWGTITLQGDTMLTSGTYRGRITGAGNLYFRQNNTAHLYGTNDYLGDTILMDLIVECHSLSNLPPTSVVVVGQGSGVVGTANINYNSLLRLDASQNIAGLADGTFMSPTNFRSVDIGGSATATLTLSNNTRNLYYSGAISNSSGTLSLVKDGSYTQTLAGTGAYSGTTRIASGTLVLGSAGAIGSSVLDLSGGTGGVLNFGVLTNVAIGGLQGTNSLALTNATGAAVTLTVGKDDGQSYTYSGAVTGIGGVAKSGNNSEYLDNTNTYTGITTITAGYLYLTANGAIPNSAQIIVGSGATFDVAAAGGLTLNGAARQLLGGSGAVSGSVIASSGSTLNPGTNGLNGGTLTINNDLTLNGGVTNLFDLSSDPVGVSNPNDKLIVFGNLNLSGVNPVKINPYLLTLGSGEYPLIQYGTLAAGSEANLQLLPIGGYTMYLTNDTSISAIAVVVFPSHTPTSITWRGNGSNNNWDLVTADWSNGGLVTFFNGDSVTFDDTGSNNIPVNLLGALGPAAVEINATKNYTFGGSGKIGGATALTKDGAGTLTLLGNNDYVGGTTINSGTVHVGNGGSTGAIGSGNISDNGTLILDRSGSLSFNSTITGSGSLTLQGGGTFSLAGDATGFSGPVAVTNATVSSVDFSSLGTSGNLTLNGGALQISTSSAESPTWNIALGSGGGTINHANVLTMGDGSSYPITGNGSFTKAGSGKMILATSNSYSGLTIVANGTLQVDTGGTTAWIPNGVSLTGGNLIYSRADSYTQNGFVSGSSASSSITVNNLSPGNTNKLTFAGVNTFNAIANTSAGGTLVLDGPNSTNTLAGPLNSSANAQLECNGGVWNISQAFAPGGNEVDFNGGTLVIMNPGGYGLRAFNVPSLVINSGGLVLGAGERFSQSADGQSITLNGGVLIATNTTYGFRLANNAGGGNQASLNGYYSFTGVQTGGLLYAPGNGEQRFSLGGSGPANPGAVASWTMTGGQMVVTNAGPGGASVFLGADTAGNGTTLFSLGGTGRLLVYSIAAAQAGANQQFNWTGGTNIAFTIDASNLQSTNAPGVFGTLYNNGGAMAPGDFGSAGRTTIIGSYDITSGGALLDIDVGGLSQATIFTGATNASDNVQVTGGAVLGGSLRVHLINGFEPLAPASQSIVILTATNITGTFTNLDGSGRIAVAGNPARSFHVTITSTNVVLDGYQTPTVQAYFTHNPASGSPPLAVTFTNLSNGAGLTNLWNFGDGATSASTAATVTHTYTTIGTNTVSLTAGNGTGVNTYTVSNAVAVMAALAPSPTTLTNSFSGGVLTLTWPNAVGWRLVAETNTLASGLTTNTNDWHQVSTTSPFTVTPNPANGTVFYRLVYP